MKTQGHQQDVLFLSGTRTGFGSFGGTLKDLSAIDLGVIAAKAALERAKVEPGQVDHVVFGNALQTSADAIYMARHVALKSGLPIETPAVTVNRPLRFRVSNPSSRARNRFCWASRTSCWPEAPSR
jgi:acetyl-CoA acyltransferase 2